MRHLRVSSSPTLFPYTTLFRSGGKSLIQQKLHEDTAAAKVIIKVLGQNESESNKDILQLLVLDRKYDPKLRNLATKALDRKSTRLNSSHVAISNAVFCLKKKSR